MESESWRDLLKMRRIFSLSETFKARSCCDVNKILFQITCNFTLSLTVVLISWLYLNEKITLLIIFVDGKKFRWRNYDLSWCASWWAWEWWWYHFDVIFFCQFHKKGEDEHAIFCAVFFLLFWKMVLNGLLMSDVCFSSEVDGTIEISKWAACCFLLFLRVNLCKNLRQNHKLGFIWMPKKWKMLMTLLPPVLLV